MVADIIAQVAGRSTTPTRGVIHRDVKPANIYHCRLGTVKITDFGIARVDTSNLTQAGQLLGTPNYMSPEQIQGKEVDHRADIFSLGVVLYEMLTRHKPFQGENLTVVSHRIVYDQFTPPRDYSKDLPPGMEKILDRALEKDPARRYQRAKDMVADLRRLLAESSRDDLNETMSIASWVAAPGPSPGPGGMGAPGADDAGTVVAAAPRKSAKAPRAPRTPSPPLSFKRIGLFAVLGVLILVLGVVALRLGVAWSGGRAAVEPAANDRNARYHALILEGEERLGEADYGAALQSFSRAVDLAPNDFEKARVLGRIKDAEAQNLAYLQTLSQSNQIAGYLKMGTDALTDERYADAVKAADLALAGDAANVEALRIKTEAEAGLARLRQQKARSSQARTPVPQVAVATPQPEASPPPEEPVKTAENQTSRLRLSVQSEVPDVTVMIRLKNRAIFSETFRTSARGGVFRRATGGVDAERALELPAGINNLQTFVTPKGKAAVVVSRSGNFPGGETRTLHVRVSESGSVSVNLD